MTIRRPLILALLLAAAAAQAQTVWRCGDDGRSYSDSPCPEGRLVTVADPRSPGDLATARTVLARDQRLARHLVAERRDREREARARGSGLAAIGTTDGLKPAPKPKAVKERPTRRPTKSRPAAGEQTSRAVAPGSRQTPG